MNIMGDIEGGIHTVGKRGEDEVTERTECTQMVDNQHNHEEGNDMRETTTSQKVVTWAEAEGYQWDREDGDTSRDSHTSMTRVWVERWHPPPTTRMDTARKLANRRHN